MIISPVKRFDRILTAPFDKSQTIRAIILGAVAKGRTTVKNTLICGDTASALACVRTLGAKVAVKDNSLVITPAVISGEYRLDAGNSATVMRLLTGLLCGIEGVSARISGDRSLRNRDMSGLIKPLMAMGAEIESCDGFPPLMIKGKKLDALKYTAEQASAQVKSAVLLAGLMSKVSVEYCESVATRRYTEQLIKAMGGDVGIVDNTITLRPSDIFGTETEIGGDPSSAAYPIAAAAITGGKAVVKRVSLSRERSGFLKVFERMGAETDIKKRGENAFGDIVEISCRGRVNLPFIVEGDEVPALIDEIPLLAIAACFVDGVSVIRGASSLKNKESDRIAATVDAINAMGGKARAFSDGMEIYGEGGLDGGKPDSRFDHRIAMSVAVGLLGSRYGGEVETDSVSISYPDFVKDIL